MFQFSPNTPGLGTRARQSDWKASSCNGTVSIGGNARRRAVKARTQGAHETPLLLFAEPFDVLGPFLKFHGPLALHLLADLFDDFRVRQRGDVAGIHAI